jgi:hypothetical protein
VVIAEALAAALREDGYELNVEHRDVGRSR